MEILNIIIDVITTIAKAVMGVFSGIVTVITAIAKAVMVFGGNAADVIAAIPGVLNNNQGVLALLGIVTAIIPPGIPDKKKLTIYSGLDYDEQGNYSIELYLYNAGNIPLYLKYIEVNQVSKRWKRKENWPHKPWMPNEGEAKYLEPKKEYHYSSRQITCVKGQEKNTDLMIVITTEEKTFKKKIGWAVG